MRFKPTGNHRRGLRVCGIASEAAITSLKRPGPKVLPNVHAAANRAAKTVGRGIFSALRHFHPVSLTSRHFVGKPHPRVRSELRDSWCAYAALVCTCARVSWTRRTSSRNPGALPRRNMRYLYPSRLLASRIFVATACAWDLFGRLPRAATTRCPPVRDWILGPHIKVRPIGTSRVGTTGPWIRCGDGVESVCRDSPTRMIAYCRSRPPIFRRGS